MRRLIIILFLLFAYSVKAQSIIQSVVPASGINGQQLYVVIRVTGMQLQSGNVQVEMGAGILVQSIDVVNSLTVRAGIEITSSAAIGLRDVRVISGTQIATQNGAFEVIESGNGVLAMLEVIPVQTLYASDFDPENPQAAPLLFRITVVNDQTTRNRIKVVFSLLLEGSGLLGKAIKKYPVFGAGSSIRFDNREFESYEFSPQSQAVAEQVQNTGVLPAGNYTYRIEVFDEDNKLIASAEAENTLTNQSTDLVLIAPGSPLEPGISPDIIPSAPPLFQWISNANQFDLYLYKVSPGMMNTTEILQQLPVYKQLGLSGQTFTYPLSAEPLEQGQTYAWQLRAYINTASGNLMVQSPVYWFNYGSSGSHFAEIASFRVVPEVAEVSISGTIQFKVIALDALGNVVPTLPVWKVVPSTDGIIQSSGFFTAGKYPKTLAVSASYAGHQDHAIVTIKYVPPPEFRFDLIYEVFGNPSNIKPGN